MILQPKRKEAEHADGQLGTDTADAAGDAEGTSALTGLNNGDWASYDPVNFTGIDSITFRVAARTRAARSSCARTARGRRCSARPRCRPRAARAAGPTSRSRRPRDKSSMGLFLVFKGTANFRLNFFEVNGKGLSPETRPTVKITAPAENAAVQAGQVTLTADATDAENAITKVEFFVDGAKIGEDTTAPYSVDWTQTTEKFYSVYAVATNAKGLTGDSRKVRFSVGESGIRPPWETFANVDAAFDKVGDEFTVSAAGADLWQGAERVRHGLPAGRRGRELHRDRQGRLVRRHARVLQGGDHGPQPDPAGRRQRQPGLPRLRREGQRRSRVHARRRRQRPGQQHGRAGGDRLRHGQRPDVAEGGEVRHEVLGLLLAQRHRLDAGRRHHHDPSAAATQDIGLFVISHISGTRATAKFTNWSLDTDPDVPEEPPTPAPSCPPTLRTSSTARSTAAAGPSSAARRPQPATANGALNMSVINGDIDGANTARSPTSARSRPPGTGRRTTKVTLDHDNAWQYGAPRDPRRRRQLHEAHVHPAHGRAPLRGVLDRDQRGPDGARRQRLRRADLPATIHLRLTNTNGTLTGACSTDGTDWTNMGGTGPLKSSSTIGLLAAGDPDAQNKTAAFDCFRVTPDEAEPKPAAERRVRRHLARRLPLGQDPRLELQPGQARRRQAPDHDVRRRHQRGRQRPDREPHPPDAAER